MKGGKAQMPAVGTSKRAVREVSSTACMPDSVQSVFSSSFRQHQNERSPNTSRKPATLRSRHELLCHVADNVSFLKCLLSNLYQHQLPPAHVQPLKGPASGLFCRDSPGNPSKHQPPPANVLPPSDQSQMQTSRPSCQTRLCNPCHESSHPQMCNLQVTAVRCEH